MIKSIPFFKVFYLLGPGYFQYFSVQLNWVVKPSFTAGGRTTPNRPVKYVLMFFLPGLFSVICVYNILYITVYEYNDFVESAVIHKRRSKSFS